MHITISIAMATYNGEAYIIEQLNSIINQTLPPDEIIIVDDCSTDNTIKLINDFSCNLPIKVIVNDRNRGVKYSFNKALENTNGEYILLSDQDDVWLSSKIEIYMKHVKLYENKNYPLLIFSDLLLVDEKLVSLDYTFWQYFKINPEHICFEKNLYTNTITGCTMLLNRPLLKLCLPIPEKAILHDYWIGLIATSLGNYVYINDAYIKYRQHSHNVTETHNMTFFMRLHIFIKELLYNKELFLNRELIQATHLYEIYGSQLNESDNLTLAEFLNLKLKSYFFRKKKALNIK